MIPETRGIGWKGFGSAMKAPSCRKISVKVIWLNTGWWPICHGQIHTEKLKQKYFKLKIIIIKGFFWSLKHEESIKNVPEALRRLIHIDKALQRLTIQWRQVVYDADSAEETRCHCEQKTINPSIN